jgi:hypothetical protein
MFLAGFEPVNPATKRPHTHAVDRAATGIDIGESTYIIMIALLTIIFATLILICVSRVFFYAEANKSMS